MGLSSCWVACCAISRREMNGFLFPRPWFILEMNGSGLHVRRVLAIGSAFPSWRLHDAEAISFWSGAERILRGWVVPPAALQFF